jgi:type II secretory pathway component PulK
MTKDQLEAIREQLKDYYSAIDNLLYDRYSVESFRKRLSDIQDSIDLIDAEIDKPEDAREPGLPGWGTTKHNPLESDLATDPDNKSRN